MRQLKCNAKSAFQTQVLVKCLFQTKCCLALVCQDLGFCTREQFGIDLAVASVSVESPICQTTKSSHFVL